MQVMLFAIAARIIYAYERIHFDLKTESSIFSINPAQ